MKDNVRSNPLDMVASWDTSNTLTVTTRGGQEYSINTRMALQDVKALEDGLLMKCKVGNSNQHCYITLTGHPLNDMHPLTLLKYQFNEPAATDFDVVWVSEHIPFMITYTRDKVSFNLVYRHNPPSKDAAEQYGRHPINSVMAD